MNRERSKAPAPDGAQPPRSGDSKVDTRADARSSVNTVANGDGAAVTGLRRRVPHSDVKELGEDGKEFGEDGKGLGEDGKGLGEDGKEQGEDGKGMGEDGGKAECEGAQSGGRDFGEESRAGESECVRDEASDVGSKAKVA